MADCVNKEEAKKRFKFGYSADILFIDKLCEDTEAEVGKVV